MLRISLDNPRSGWAFARLAAADGEFLVTGSYSPTDAIGDLIEAVERLETATSADCCWFQEPGELHWKMRRAGAELEVEILRFADAFGQHWRESECVFKANGKWLTFARQLLSCVELIRVNLGCDNYEREWRRPFPAREQQRLREAIKKFAKNRQR